MEANELVRLATVRGMARDGRARRIRLDADISLSQIGKVCGVSGTTIFRWEVGECLPTGQPALRYLQLLNDLSSLRRGRSRRLAASR